MLTDGSSTFSQLHLSTKFSNLTVFGNMKPSKAKRPWLLSHNKTDAVAGWAGTALSVWWILTSSRLMRRLKRDRYEHISKCWLPIVLVNPSSVSWHCFFLCPALCLNWHWQPNCYLANRINCHTCLPTSTHCCCSSATPCESVAKIRFGNSFSVAKLVTREVGQVGCRPTGSGSSLVICKHAKDQYLN